MGEVEELENLSPLIEDVKRAIVDYLNKEFEIIMLMKTLIHFSQMKDILGLPIQPLKMATMKYSMK